MKKLKGQVEQEARYRLFCIVFILFLLIPSFGFLGSVDSAVRQENRILTSRPKLSFSKSIVNFSTEYMAYFQDNFLFRTQLVAFNSYVNLKLFQSSDIDTVKVGKNGWLYYADDNAVKDHQSVCVHLESEISEWGNYFRVQKTRYEKMGIEYYLVVVPTKQTVYPEFLPYSYRKIGSETCWGKVKTQLQGSSDVKIIDLHDLMLLQKSQGQIYYKRNIHWTDEGSLAASGEIVSTLQKDFNRLRSQSELDVYVQKNTTEMKGLGRMLGLGSYLSETINRIGVKDKRARRADGLSADHFVLSTNNKALPNILILGDSFFSPRYRLPIYLAESFNILVYFNDPFAKVTNAVLKVYKPDIVVQGVISRKFSEPLIYYCDE